MMVNLWHLWFLFRMCPYLRYSYMQSSMILPVDALVVKGTLVDSLVTRLFLADVVVSPGVFAVVVASLDVAVVVTSLGVATIKRGLKLYKVTWLLKLGSFIDVTTSASTIARFIFCHYWLSA